MPQKKGMSSKTKLGIGLGLGALAAAAAGAYYLYGAQEGAKRRAKIKGWVLKAKGEVLEKLEDLKEVNERVYHKVIDNVARKYSGMKNVDPKELKAMVVDLKKHWKHIKSQVELGGKIRAKAKRK